MENAQLISLSRQIALQRQMDVVANNMANINTTGFKAESMLFEDYVMPTASDNNFAGLDQDLHYTEDWSTIHDMTTGSIEQTGNPLDVALSGKGFLTVQTPAGQRYTRNGSLQIDASGTLVDLNGNPVLGESGPIKFDPSDTDIAISIERHDQHRERQQGQARRRRIRRPAGPRPRRRQLLFRPGRQCRQPAPRLSRAPSSAPTSRAWRPWPI